MNDRQSNALETYNAMLPKHLRLSPAMAGTLRTLWRATTWATEGALGTYRGSLEALVSRGLATADDATVTSYRISESGARAAERIWAR